MRQKQQKCQPQPTTLLFRHLKHSLFLYLSLYTRGKEEEIQILEIRIFLQDVVWSRVILEKLVRFLNP